jgi:hypothetical protein
MKDTVVPAAQKVEFEILKPGAPDKLFVCVFGKPGTGKTRLMATAPGLGVIPLQRKTRRTVEDVIKDLYPGRKVWWPKNHEEFYKYQNPMAMAMMEREDSKKFYRDLVNRVKVGCWSLLDLPEVKTIGIDSNYTLYQMIVAAHYGKSGQLGSDKTLWGPPNDEMREFLTSLQPKHLVVTTEAKAAYQGKNALDYDDPAGYKSIGYDANVLVETHFSVADGFWLDVRMCQDRAALMGEAGQHLLSGDMIEFKYLACELRPDSSIEDWE